MTQMSQFEQTDTGLLVRAPAKINLSLLITGKRPDGYHPTRHITSNCVMTYTAPICRKWMR
jgi:hypothetical protein